MAVLRPENVLDRAVHDVESHNHAFHDAVKRYRDAVYQLERAKAERAEAKKSLEEIRSAYLNAVKNLASLRDKIASECA